ncbi:hypothetical protein BJ508DRAFT_305647 [Ascobolus immersus RN42]|uniref:Apple domain-containing protein n=1 Tax=Ascobolus immersus RN42 TaxID=1160509 RepID=A0A3N4I8W4_ASCIM|nr:hypothetical protein BJ508DRAFT_305647 [Ascobolus immersus RN42]
MMKATSALTLLSILFSPILASPVAVPAKCDKNPSKAIQDIIKKLEKTGSSANQLRFPEASSSLKFLLRRRCIELRRSPTIVTSYTTTITETIAPTETVTFVKRETDPNWKASLPATLLKYTYDHLVTACTTCLSVPKPIAHTKTKTSISKSIVFSVKTISITKTKSTSTSTTSIFQTATTTTVNPPEPTSLCATFSTALIANGFGLENLINLPDDLATNAQTRTECCQVCGGIRGCVAGVYRPIDLIIPPVAPGCYLYQIGSPGSLEPYATERSKRSVDPDWCPNGVADGYLGPWPQYEVTDSDGQPSFFAGWCLTGVRDE